MMGVTNFEWGQRLQSEADKCWFYAISFSIALSLYRFFGLLLISVTSSTNTIDPSKTGTEKDSKKANKQVSAARSEYSTLLTRLTIDCCDLTIPGSSTGWIPVQVAIVGAAQFLSSALAGLQIWSRVQAQP